MRAASIVRARAMPPGTPEVPAVIVGGGACGLVAALGLRHAGIECVVVERDARPSGSTALSSGFIPAAGTRVQQAAGVHDDSAERHAADIQAKARGTAAPHLVSAYTLAAGPALAALTARHGIGFELLDGFSYPGHSARRMHCVPQRTGAALMQSLEVAADRAGAHVLCEARVCELWCDGDRMLGVGIERPDGLLEYIACRALLLACNGYGGNAGLVRELLPPMRDATFAGHAGNDGSAIAWGRALGARLADLQGCQGHGSWAVPHGVLITWALMTEGGVQVNALGRRFHDETEGYSEAAVAVLAQPGSVAWCVIDTRLAALGRRFPDFVHAESLGAVRTAPHAGALATLIGCDPATLTQTLAATRLQPPFYAIKVTGALFHTQGGLDIDSRCRVLREDHSPLPNLLAAGGAARGVSGNEVWGYLSGNGLLSAVAGGHIAARTIKEMLQR